MFTGIIKDVGTLTDIDATGGGRKLTVRSRFAGALEVDESVSVNGACQTVVARDDDTFQVVAVEETLRKTTLGQLEVKAPVNLERAMKAGARLDGHFVQGHVDTTGTVVAIEEEEADRLYTIRFPESFASYLIPVGSITVDGISLTVARLAGDTFTVAIIPHTIRSTNIDQAWHEGARVNLEFDMIGKYVARIMSVGASDSPEMGDAGIHDTAAPGPSGPRH